MGFLIGILVRGLTFPGVILDLLINLLVAKILKIEIIEMNHLFVINGNPIEIAEPKEYSKLFIFAIIPFILMTIIAIPFCYLYVAGYSGWYGWLGVSIATHSFPEIAIGKMIWARNKIEFANKNYFSLFAYPFVILIYVIRVLHIFWIDILYGFLIIGAIKYLFQ